MPPGDIKFLSSSDLCFLLTLHRIMREKRSRDSSSSAAGELLLHVTSSRQPACPFNRPQGSHEYLLNMEQDYRTQNVLLSKKSRRVIIRKSKDVGGHIMNVLC